MTSENHQENNDRLEIREKVSKLTNMGLAYALGMFMNHKYNTGGYSVGRSERSFLLDLFFRLNYDDAGKFVQGLDPFNNGEIFLDEIKKREVVLDTEDKNVAANIRQELDLNDKKIFAALVLRFWIKHYREKVIENSQKEHTTHADFSFESEIARAETLYKLYLSDLDIDEDVLDIVSEKYVDEGNKSRDILKYTNEFRWHVDDLTQSEEKEID